jgi:hypothetical protein
MSPIAEFADHILVAPTEGPSPFDSRVVVLAQGEAIVAGLVKRNADKARSRLTTIERLRERGAELARQATLPHETEAAAKPGILVTSQTDAPAVEPIGARRSFGVRDRDNRGQSL